ncbi:response regulator [Cyanobacteria bacterium FACHB-DQ100]|nr:response regulator [Cyanobacteria bacterium FACHB-DQ100]
MEEQGRRILIVDGSWDNLWVLQVFLADEGYQVEVANSGESALAQASAFSPNVMLLDFMMPGLDGAQVIQRIRQHPVLNALPILLMTAHQAGNEGFAAAIGADGFIPKPIEFDKLLDRIRGLRKATL